MKLKYQTLTKEEREKIKEDFLNSKDCVLYNKAHRILLVALFGFLIGIISIGFDLYYKANTLNYVLDGFLLVFTLIFIIIMRNIKLKEINNFVIKKSKKTA